MHVENLALAEQRVSVLFISVQAAFSESNWKDNSNCSAVGIWVRNHT